MMLLTVNYLVERR